jgi:hypothetical protein
MTTASSTSSSTLFPAPPASYHRKPGLGSLVSGVPEIILGVGFLITWWDPDRLGTDWVRFALELMLLEFILIHSAGFMGMKARRAETFLARVGWFGGIGAFYSIFVIGFCLSLDTWRPMIAFWVITLQRLAADVLDPKPSEETQAWFGVGLAANVMLYLGGVMLTLFLPLPEFGVTGFVRDEVGLEAGGGVWSTEPHRVVVLAALYYLLRGWMTANAWPRTVTMDKVKTSRR